MLKSFECKHNYRLKYIMRYKIKNPPAAFSMKRSKSKHLWMKFSVMNVLNRRKKKSICGNLIFSRNLI